MFLGCANGEKRYEMMPCTKGKNTGVKTLGQCAGIHSGSGTAALGEPAIEKHEGLMILSQ